MNPRDDYLMKYDWKIISCYAFDKLEDAQQKDWEVTITISRERESNNFYYRKLK